MDKIRKINSFLKVFFMFSLLSLVFVSIWIFQRTWKTSHLFQTSSAQAQCWIEESGSGSSDCSDSDGGDDDTSSCDSGGCGCGCGGDSGCGDNCGDCGGGESGCSGCDCTA